MVPPSGASAGAGNKPIRPPSASGKGLAPTLASAVGGYQSSDQAQPGIEIDPFTGIPYYDPK